MLRRDMYWLGKDKTRFGPPYQFQLGFPSGSVGKNLPAIVGDADVGLIPELGRSSRGGNGNPLQYSCLENSMDRGAWVGYSLWGHKEWDTTEHSCKAKAPVWGKSSLHASGGLRLLAGNFLVVRSMKITKSFPGRSVFLVFKSLRLAA